ncbi:hypothetical protein Tco_0221608 [Tanacetum coccineum]
MLAGYEGCVLGYVAFGAPRVRWKGALAKEHKESFIIWTRMCASERARGGWNSSCLLSKVEKVNESKGKDLTVGGCAKASCPYCHSSLGVVALMEDTIPPPHELIPRLIENRKRMNENEKRMRMTKKKEKEI